MLALAGLLAITLWLRHDNLNLSRSLATANGSPASKKTALATLNQQLSLSQRMPEQMKMPRSGSVRSLLPRVRREQDGSDYREITQ